MGPEGLLAFPEGKQPVGNPAILKMNYPSIWFQR